MAKIHFTRSPLKRRRYLLISGGLVAIFFIGSALIIPKITQVAEDLLESIVQEHVKSKKNVITQEFNRLGSYMEYSQRILSGTTDTTTSLWREKLFLVSQVAHQDSLISNSFLYTLSPDSFQTHYLYDQEAGMTASQLQRIGSRLESSSQQISIDTIIQSGRGPVNRKILAVNLTPDRSIILGYDLDLLAFWRYYSEKYPTDSGYSVVTNLQGICLLHPEPQYIGKQITGFYDAVPINAVLQSDRVLKDTIDSHYLGLQVQRYFNLIELGSTPYILTESFPLDLSLQETTSDIHYYFFWISLLAFVIFMLLLLVSRLQLRREYRESLRIQKEKEQLERANANYQKENAELQLAQLKEKMNPHFLFNSLNSLHVLIATKPEVSQEFVLTLAGVYRYLLENKDGNLALVKNEVHFLHQYTFLQEIRFKSSLKVEIIQQSPEAMSKKIPFLALQNLVENAIKHNQFTSQEPLHIKITIEANRIVVQNDYRPRRSNPADSHHIGLDYLRNIYAHHQVERFTTTISNGKFIVVLPLLQ